MTYFIDLRADSAGGNLVASAGDIVVRTDQQLNPNPASPLDPGLIQAIQGRDVLLGTHGFNVNRAAGISNLGHWTEWLQLGANGFFAGVLWPGDSRWIPVVDYPIEGNEAIKSGRLLSEYLTANFTGANSVSFASHSLGARVVLETVRNLPNSFKLRTVTMMAPAIDDTCLGSEYQDAAIRVGKISVLASNRDEVLQWAFPAGNLAAGIITRGDPYWHGALGRYGPNPPDQPSNVWKTPILPDAWNFGHHSYINSAGPAQGPPAESAPFFPPLVVPSAGTATPANSVNWQQAWAAGFVSTRFC
ncbi:MAG: alpha/beta hydrolase [Terriglobales bacterium]